MPQKVYIINGKRVAVPEGTELSEDEIDEIGHQNQTSEPQKSLFGKAWDTVFTPPKFVTDTARKVSDFMSGQGYESDQSLLNNPYVDPRGTTHQRILGAGGTPTDVAEELRQQRAKISGFTGGATEGAAGMLSPGNIALTAMGMGEAAAGERAISGALSAERAAAAAKTAYNLGQARRTVSLPIAIHGGYQMIHHDSTPEQRLAGFAELMGGTLGVKMPAAKINPIYNDNPDFGMGPMGSSGGGQPALPPARPSGLPEGDFVGEQPIRPPTTPHPDEIFSSLPIQEGEILPQIPDFNQVAQERPIPTPNAANFTPEEFAQMNEFMGNGPDPNEINALLRQMQPEAPTDPRITSEVPQYPAPLEPPPSGEIGPPVTGHQTPDLSQFPDAAGPTTPMSLGQRFGRQVAEAGGDVNSNPIRAAMETGRAERQAAINQEMGYIPPERGVPLDQMEQHMKVPTKFLQSGLNNVAIGGADPRVLDVLGSSLYSANRPTTVTKELLQNAFDEHRIAGVNKPIKVLSHNYEKIPGTNDFGSSVAVSDRGRGLAPEDIYTVLTDVGKTGKGGIEGASGGFGFAKAAPFLGGKYTKVISVHDEGGKRYEYTFEGKPSDLKNQVHGVPIKKRVVGKEYPTGLTVKTWFPKDSYLAPSRSFARQMTEMSGNIPSNVQLMEGNYGNDQDQLDSWLRQDDPNHPLNYQAENIENKGMPPKQLEFEHPGAKVKLHFETPEPGSEENAYNLGIMNKGLFQMTERGGYGQTPIPDVPSSIVADIIATVEEGHENYPFTANREQLNNDLSYAIKNYINKNVAEVGRQNRIRQLQAKYDAIAPLGPNTTMAYYDSGNLYTPEELQQLNSSPAFKALSDVIQELHISLVTFADTLNWQKQYYGSKIENWLPSKRNQRVGFLFESGKKDGTTLGVHLTSPADLDHSTILYNVFEQMNLAKKDGGNIIDRLATDFFATITHEIAHIPGGSHDEGFAYRHAQLLGQLGKHDTVYMLEDLANAIGDQQTGQINPELQNLLDVYNQSRGRAEGTTDALLSTGIGSTRPTGAQGSNPNNVNRTDTSGGRPGAFERLGNFIGKDKAERFRNSYDLARGLTSVDLPFLTSAAFRQGINWFGTKYWMQAWAKQAQAFGDKAAYVKQRDMLERDPLFAPRMTFQGNRATPQKSIAEQMGLELTDLTDLTQREEALRSTLAERIPVWGKYVAASNRAYTAFLNHIRANAFKDMVTARGIWNGRQITDVPMAKQVADFINTTTGRAPLKATLGVSEKYSATLNLEQHAKLFADAFFSPKLQFSRMKMLNPSTYIMAPKNLRMAWINSFLRMVAAWTSMAWLLKTFVGGTVSTDPNSSDFGKVKVGNTRLDPGGGFQQYMVIAHRIMPQIVGHAMAPTEFSSMVEPTDTGILPLDMATGYFGHQGGGITSPISGQFNPYGEGYRPETAWTDLARFTSNKLHPIPRMGFDFLNRDARHPYYPTDRAMQLFLPMFTSDINEAIQGDSTLLPLILTGSSIGWGTQTFEGGPGKPSITPLFGIEEEGLK